MKKPFSYEFKAMLLLRQLIKEAQTRYPQATIIRDYVDYYNDTCPRCQQKIRVSGLTIQKIGTMSYFGSLDGKYVYFYAACKQCAKEIALDSNYGFSIIDNSTKVGNTEKYILQTLQNVQEE